MANLGLVPGDRDGHEPRADSLGIATLLSEGGGEDHVIMGSRIARLEYDVQELSSDLKAIRSDLAYLRGKADNLPTTVQLIFLVVTMVVVAGLFRWLVPA